MQAERRNTNHSCFVPLVNLLTPVPKAMLCRFAVPLLDTSRCVHILPILLTSPVVLCCDFAVFHGHISDVQNLIEPQHHPKCHAQHRAVINAVNDYSYDSSTEIIKTILEQHPTFDRQSFHNHQTHPLDHPLGHPYPLDRNLALLLGSLPSHWIKIGT
jgi:hypothetical protein